MNKTHQRYLYLGQLTKALHEISGISSYGNLFSTLGHGGGLKITQNGKKSIFEGFEYTSEENVAKISIFFLYAGHAPEYIR